MPRPYRKERLDELLKRELESIICYELNDPRLDHITVSEVDVSKDLQTARVYIGVLEDKAKEREVMNGLEDARGFIRNQIAGRVQLRKVPDLVFRLDRTLGDVQRIDTIIDQLEFSPGNDAEQRAAASVSPSS
jgi:ribosome-binding factor A